MNLTEAAKATAEFFVTRVDFGEFCVGTHEGYARSVQTHAEAIVVRDRLNLLGVLEAIREPTQAMIDAAPGGDLATLHGAVYVWRAMIDALTAEVKRADVAALADAVLALVERVRELEAPSQAVITEEWLDFRTAPRKKVGAK